jgi:hypothetical protein
MVHAHVARIVILSLVRYTEIADLAQFFRRYLEIDKAHTLR